MCYTGGLSGVIRHEIFINKDITTGVYLSPLELVEKNIKRTSFEVYNFIRGLRVCA